MIDVFNLRTGIDNDGNELRHPLKSAAFGWSARGTLLKPAQSVLSGELFKVNRGTSVRRPLTTTPLQSLPQFKSQPITVTNPASAGNLVYDSTTHQAKYPVRLGKGNILA